MPVIDEQGNDGGEPFFELAATGFRAGKRYVNESVNCARQGRRALPAPTRRLSQESKFLLDGGTISHHLPCLIVGADPRVRPNKGRHMGLPLHRWRIVHDSFCIREF
jgi:hypothetical protein